MSHQSHPAFRIFTFGGFSIERLILPAPSPTEEQRACYEPVAKAEWHRRTAARTLLKVLLCRRHRRASKDELLDLLWPDTHTKSASRSLNTAASILRTVLRTQESDTENLRLRAHLLASAAENAAFLGETELVQTYLRTSELLLEQLPVSHEEFDHASWHQYAGTCALILKHYDHAITELQQAMSTLPPQWTLRHATTLIPLVIAYARKRERQACLEMTSKAVQFLEMIKSPSLSRQLTEYIRQELLGSFPNDPQVNTFVADVQHQLLFIQARAVAD